MKWELPGRGRKEIVWEGGYRNEQAPPHKVPNCIARPDQHYATGAIPAAVTVFTGRSCLDEGKLCGWVGESEESRRKENALGAFWDGKEGIREDKMTYPMEVLIGPPIVPIYDICLARAGKMV